MFRQTLSVAFAAAALASASPSCRDVSFTVSGTAQNYNLTGVDILNSLSAILLNVQGLGTVTVSGSQTLVGTYCEPTVRNKNNKRLQILYHGITSSRIYWDALGGSQGFPPFVPANYSWVDYATSQGYPTLAMDRLGAGQSSKPDPILVVQSAYESALYHDLAQQIKAGTTPIPRYNDLTYVGHSYGSELGASAANLYPDDYTNIILTGFSKLVQPSLPGVSLQLPIPAAIQNPARFGGLSPGYVTSSAEVTKTNSFFGTIPGRDYIAKIAQLFFQRQDTVTLGQFLSVYIGNSPAPPFTGRVFVLTGADDQAFCGPGSILLGPADCTTLVPNTKTLFPNADYSWKIVPNTGHAVNLHYTAHDSFVSAHQFLAGATFASPAQG